MICHQPFKRWLVRITLSWMHSSCFALPQFRDSFSSPDVVQTLTDTRYSYVDIDCMIFVHANAQNDTTKKQSIMFQGGHGDQWHLVK